MNINKKSIKAWTKWPRLPRKKKKDAKKWIHDIYMALNKRYREKGYVLFPTYTTKADQL